MRPHVSARWALIVAFAVASLTTAVIARQATGGNPEAAKVQNPVPTSPESMAAGKKVYDSYCGPCHGADATGGLILSITEDRGLPPPPDLADDKWDHGGTDGEIFATIKNGVPPDYIMGKFDGRIPDTDIWNTINYLRSLAKKH